MQKRWMSLLLVVLILSGTPSLSSADSDEQAVLQELFTLNRTLEVERKEISRLEGQVSELTLQQAKAEEEQHRLAAQLEVRQEAFGRRLRYYHEDGNFGSAAFLLASRTFRDFLQRLDLLSQILQRDSELIGEFRSSRKAVEENQLVLRRQRETVAQARTERKQQEERLSSEVARKEQMLVDLREQRQGVEERLDEVERTWQTTAKPVLDSLSNSINSLSLSGGAFQPDSIKLSLSPPGIIVRVSEATLNQFFAQKGDLKGLAFQFAPNGVNLQGQYGSTRLLIKGMFAVRPKSVLRYEPTEIYVGDFQVPQRTVREIMESGRLDLNVGPMLKTFTLNRIVVEQNYMEVYAGGR